MRVADLIAQTLHAHGVRHAFGMPGGEVVTLIDALEKAGIRFVLCRHETAAAIMAAGAAMETGAPGLLVTTLGPGLTNAVNGIADASQEHVPLIAMAGVVEHGIRGRYTHQIIDQPGLMNALVKGSFEIEERGAAGTMARALRLSRRSPSGPVFVQLSPDTAAKRGPEGECAARPAARLRPALDAGCEAVTAIVEGLRRARRPIIMAGVEAASDGLSEALHRLMAAADIPLITTYKAKGIVNETLPLVLGGAGLSPLADRELLPLLKLADFVLLLGYDPIEMRAGWIDAFAADAEVIEVSSAPPDHGMYESTTIIEASPYAVITALLPAIEASAGSPKWPESEPRKVKERLLALFAPKSEWGPGTVFDILERNLPTGAVITVDSGAHRILLSQQIKVRQPFGLLQSAGFCTMGAAVPLAAGAKIARPERRVIAVLGDGGMEMGLGELATLRDQNAPITIVVLQDDSLALIELKQAQAGLERTGVRLGRSRFEDIAPGLGGKGSRVRSGIEFETALAAAIQDETFHVIVCEIQVNDYAGKF
jgi:acetolactate synthase-1/2/3 large subunit